MREIKFKAWDKESKRMYDWKITRQYPMDYTFNSDIVTPMQYTGLKDKNGTEIYESDILECQDWDGEKYVTEVKFGDGAFYIEVNGCDYDYTVIGWAIRQDIDECCVIGNIYENPELLK